MRKWMYLGAFAVAAAGVGGYCFFDWSRLTGGRESLVRVVVTPAKTNDGDAETCEVIEPLVVDGGTVIVQRVQPTSMQEPMERVVLMRGMTQPPRPDADPGRVLRMPYADEEEILAQPLDPMVRILDSTLPRLNVFDELKHNDPAEEAENKETGPTPPVPAMDYHHQHPHCPAMGGSYPYRRY